MCGFRLKAEKPQSTPVESAKVMGSIAILRHSKFWEADVCFGSKADIAKSLDDVRFTPESGHSAAPFRCPLCANPITDMKDGRSILDWERGGFGFLRRLFLLYKIEARLTWNSYAHRYTYPAEGEFLCREFGVRQQ
jgi:hypothetical protein